jgi:hypothetical protein
MISDDPQPLDVYDGPLDLELPEYDLQEWAGGGDLDALVDNLTSEPLQEAFDPTQPRFPKGHARAGQWRPKLAPELADVLEKDLKPIRDKIDRIHAVTDNDDEPGWVGRADAQNLQALGDMLGTLAAKHSTFTAYHDRRKAQEAKWADLDEERYRTLKQLDSYLIDPQSKGNVISDWTDRAGRLIDSPERQAERQKLLDRVDELNQQQTDIQAEVTRLGEAEKRARRDAIVGVIAKIRPMGGKIDTSVGTVAGVGLPSVMTEHAQEHVREIQRLIPTDWIDDMNRAGTLKIQIHQPPFRAYHQSQTHTVRARPTKGGAPPITPEQLDSIDWAHKEGGEYVGMYDNRWPVIRRPGTTEGGIGPNAAIYDWVNDNGAMRNLTFGIPAAEGRAAEAYHPDKLNREAPLPPVSEQTTVDSTIHMTSDSPAAIFLHETLHRVQAVPGSRTLSQLDPTKATSTVRHRAEYNYLTWRSGGSNAQPEKLTDLQPNSGYEEHEMSIPDRWPSPYYGKVYSGGYGATEYNELLTMAIQDLYYDPATLWATDQETYQWALGLLAAT